MPPTRLPRELAQQALDALAAHGENKAAAARALGLGESTLKARLAIAARDGVGTPGAEPPPPPDPVQRDALADARAANRALRAQLDQSESERRDLMRLRETAFKLAPDHVGPVRWKLDRKRGAPKRELPILFTSDHQAGEVIDPAALGGLNAYNLDIYRARYRRLIETTINIVTRHHGGADQIVYLRGGDTISGGIHEDLAETEVPAPVQCVAAIEEEAAGIRHLADAFGRVTVISTPGNHDRTTRKPRSKNYTLNSFELLIAYAIEAQIARDPKYRDKVRFLSNPAGEVYFDLFGWTNLLTHGDRIGSRGGQGFIGPAATILRGAKKVRDQYGSVRASVDFLWLGHFHYPMDVDEGVIVNGTLAGLSEYARDLRVKVGPPSQKLYFMHPDHGLTVKRTIHVEPPQPAAAGLKAEKIA